MTNIGVIQSPDLTFIHVFRCWGSWLVLGEFRFWGSWLVFGEFRFWGSWLVLGEFTCWGSWLVLAFWVSLRVGVAGLL